MYTGRVFAVSSRCRSFVCRLGSVPHVFLREFQLKSISCKCRRFKERIRLYPSTHSGNIDILNHRKQKNVNERILEMLRERCVNHLDSPDNRFIICEIRGTEIRWPSRLTQFSFCLGELIVYQQHFAIAKKSELLASNNSSLSLI